MELTSATEHETGNEIKPEAVEKFAKENRVAASNEVGCVDGRYKNDQSPGKLSRPGGHYGYILSLLATLNMDNLTRTKSMYKNLAPEQIVDLVHEAVTANGEKFYMHTDEHDDGRHVGCGHASKPIDHSGMYGLLDAESANRALKRIREITDSESSQNDKTIIWETLQGPHAEEGVIVNQGMHYTLKPTDGNNMFFVYDAQRDKEYMGRFLLPKIADKLKISGIKRIDFVQEFINYSELQTEATLELLAANLPRFTTNMDEQSPAVNLIPNEKAKTKADPAHTKQLIDNLLKKAA